MATIEDISHQQSKISYNKMNGEPSSSLTTMVYIPDSPSHVSLLHSSKPINDDDKNDIYQPFLQNRRKTTKMISLADISRRLSKRKLLHNRLCPISTIMCILGLFGIILMIIENELSFKNSNHKQTNFSWFIKSLISLTTIILLLLIIYYNYLNLKLHAVNNYIDNWRIGLTENKIFFIILEIFICLIHPIPYTIPFIQKNQSYNSTLIESISSSSTNIDIALSLPMFARVYLFCRYIIYHSHLLRNVSSQSLGSLNQVSVNFFFVIKTYLEQWPTRCLLIFEIFLFLIGSWSLRLCNYNSLGEHFSMLDSMWLFIVTFTTVGYGDLTPTTYCGRTIASLIGLLGILSTALLISVLAQKLTLTRSEKYVHNFVLNIQLAKERKNQAANIIKFACKMWYLKRKKASRSNDFIKAQRRLTRAIGSLQQLKHEQKKLVDNCIGFPELVSTQREANTKIEENAEQSTNIQTKIEHLEEKIIHINQAMINIQNTLDIILNKMS